MSEFTTKDSGEHAQYDSGMRRDTEAGKPRFDLIRTKLQPYEEQMIYRYAMLLARGAEKYDARNWEDGDSEVELDRAKSSLLRHTEQLVAGEDDEDHAAAVWFNTQAIEYFRWRIAQKTERIDGIRQELYFPVLECHMENVDPEVIATITGLATASPWVSHGIMGLAPAVSAKERDDEDGFTIAREQHRALLDDWHGQDDQGTVQLRVTGEVQSVSATIDGTEKRRVDDWLQEFNMDLVAGDLGDPHVLISREEFSDRVKNTDGVRWRAKGDNATTLSKLRAASKSGVAQTVSVR
jgi:hypothetical protein